METQINIFTSKLGLKAKYILINGIFLAARKKRKIVLTYSKAFDKNQEGRSKQENTEAIVPVYSRSYIYLSNCNQFLPC